MHVRRPALDEFTVISTGDAALAARCMHPESVNHMAADEPPACAERGVPGAMATSAWLRLAFSELRFDPIDVVGDDERTAVAHVWMSGRQTGPFVVFPAGRKPVSSPPTGREFAVRWQLTGSHHRAVHQAITAAQQAAETAATALATAQP